jgi:hypothetical protein
MEITQRNMLFKPQHPRVMSVLMRIKPLSPVNLVRDIHQPISGCLNDRPKLVLNTSFDEISPSKIEKQEVQLNLTLNKIRSRRNTLVSNA